MSDIRARLADALREHLTCDCGQWAEDLGDTCEHLAVVLLSLPGVAVVDAEMLRDAGEFIDREAGSAFSQDLAAALLAAANKAEQESS